MFQCEIARYTLASRNIADHHGPQTYLCSITNTDAVNERRSRSDPHVRPDLHIAVHRRPVANEASWANAYVVRDETHIANSYFLTYDRRLPEYTSGDNRVAHDVRTISNHNRAGMRYLDNRLPGADNLKT